MKCYDSKDSCSSEKFKHIDVCTLQAQKAKIGKMKVYRSSTKKADINDLVITKEIKLPVRDIITTDPEDSNLVVDKRSGYLYYSDCNKWYLHQAVDDPVNITLKEDGSGDYKSLDEVFDVFSGDPSAIGTINIKLEPGEYPMNTTDIQLGINQLNIIGDEREVVGLTYVNGKRANLSRRETDTKTNSFGETKSNTTIEFTGPNIITINVKDIDLTQIGLVVGDRIKISTNVLIFNRVGNRDDIPLYYTYTINKLEPNKIYTDLPLDSAVLNCYANGSSSPSVSFLPTVSIQPEDSTVVNTNIKMTGINIEYVLDTSFTALNFILVGDLNNCVTNLVLRAIDKLRLINSTIYGRNTPYLIMDNFTESRKYAYIYMNGLTLVGSAMSAFLVLCNVDINNSVFISSGFLISNGGNGLITMNNCIGSIKTVDQGYTPGYILDPSDTNDSYSYVIDELDNNLPSIGKLSPSNSEPNQVDRIAISGTDSADKSASDVINNIINNNIGFNKGTIKISLKSDGEKSASYVINSGTSNNGSFVLDVSYFEGANDLIFAPTEEILVTFNVTNVEFFSLRHGPLITMVNTSSSRGNGIRTRAFDINDIRCENTSRIVSALGRSTVTVFRVNFKWTLRAPINDLILWEADNYSLVKIVSDSYDFQVPVNTSSTTAFKADHYSQILIDRDTDYSSSPLFQTAYESNNNAIIGKVKMPAWPGNIITETGGRVYFG